jgi:natural product biosynthesis luciferase-like monooxygenase protein
MTADQGSTTIVCAVVGDELLAAQCASIAAEQGLGVAVIASSNPLVLESAIESGVATIDLRTVTDLAGALAEHRFDVLFSVAYLKLLPDDVLAQAATCINFHDGPLPDYAGLNVTTWAVYNGEREHGVTWHLMTSDVDRGEVVLAESFAIDPNETAFSLNARCYEAGLATFPAVAGMLASGTLTTTVQPPASRPAYRRRERPLVIVDPRIPAAELDRGARALDVGDRVRSTVGAARLVLDLDVYLVRACTPVDEPSGADPGVVVAIEDDAVQIATVEGDVTVSGFTTAAGEPLSASDVLRRHGLEAGSTLAAPPDDLVAALVELDAALADREAWWWNELALVGEPTELPFVGPTDGVSSETVDVAGISGLDAATVVAGVSAWASGVGGTEQVVLGCTDPDSRAVMSRLGPLAEPGFVGISVADRTVAQLREQSAERIAAASAHGPMLADLVARDPHTRRITRRPEIVVHLDSTTAPASTGATIDVVHDAADGTVRVAAAGADLAQSVADQLGAVLAAVVESDDRHVDQLPLLGSGDIARLADLNATALDHDRQSTIDEQFRRQVSRTPDAPAATAGDRTLTYRELAQAVDRLAARLGAVGVGPGDTVAIAVPRGLDMLCAVLAVLDRGAAYLPLDPEYPAERLAFMLEDSGTTVVVGDPRQVGLADGLTIVDPSGPHPADGGAATGEHGPADLAYLIYTSGSTGKPKGVQLEHRNVTNFFAAMDEVVGCDQPGVWLAVTSLSFDISVLELLWTVTRGFHVVVKGDSGFGAAPARRTRQASMSLFYFAASGDQAGDGYRLLMESAGWADKHGFEAVWTPERHFHDFGAPYPNPSVVAAALAATTSNIAIRAGSVVLPLHSPIRVAEEWSVVDNLSRGRVGISFAAGWQPNDFVLNPGAYADARDSLPGLIDTVRRLWRGETVSLPGPIGDVEVSTMPRPVQRELPVWLTSAGSPSTFERAGKLGINLLTHLLGQSVEQLRENIGRYRAAWREAGHEGEGRVTLMLHTFLDEDGERARETARLPLKGYLGTAVGLLKDFASAFPTFANSGGDVDAAFKSLTPEEMSQLLDMATDRYLSTSGLFGTVDEAIAMIDHVVGAGVDEVACLVDFGIATDDVLASLELLGLVHDSVASQTVDDAPVDDTVAGLVDRYGVTHLQCTPSLAAMLVANPPDREALRSVGHLMLGGEALPTALANELRDLLPGRFTNMYGPTETTIWSLTHEITGPVTDGVPIGTPIANTTIAVLDGGGRPLPIGIFGELHIGGEGVARGYHARPDLTAERFVDRPRLGPMYATGDVVRVHPDGTVQFAGRSDHQVKIRGHRIELGEIEAVLDGHSGVVQSVVVARGDVEPELVGYCVTAADATVNPDELREHVAATLPGAMVPTTVVLLDAMPLTPNGKVDRKQLPDGPVRTVADVVAAIDGDTNQALVAGIWTVVLGHPVGLDDNFFEIGGHSLLAVKVFRMVTEAAPFEVGPALHLTDVFRHPTVRTFAARLDSLASGGDGSPTKQPTVATGTDRGAMRRRALARRGTGDES